MTFGDPLGQSLSGVLREPARRGIVTSLNQMTAAGVITLLVIMTGQVLAGMEPMDTAKYQILLMFLLCGASSLAAIGAAYRLTDERGPLRVDRFLTQI